MQRGERRRHTRANINTCVTLSRGQQELGLFRVVDLSAGGALLEGHCPVGLGQELTARLHFSPCEVVTAAVAVRLERRDGGEVFAVSFSLMPELRTFVRSLIAMRGSWAEEPPTDPYLAHGGLAS